MARKSKAAGNSGPVEGPWELPEGWRWERLGDLAEFINGAAFKPSDWHGEGRPIIRIQNLTNPEKSPNLTRSVLADKYIVEAGDILLSWSATLDVFVWRGENAWLNQHIFKIANIRPDVDKRFFRFLLKNEIETLKRSEHLHGSTMMHINRGPFMAHPVPIPPIATQVEIAARIDALFSEIDEGEAVLTKARAGLETYRKSLLKWSVTGGLTADWRHDNPPQETGEQLLQHILADRRARWHANPKNARKRYAEPVNAKIGDLHDLPMGWTWATIEQICDPNRPIAYGVLQPGADQQDGVPLIRVTDVADGQIQQNNLKRIDRSIAAKFPRTFLRGGEVLLTLVGSIGRTAIVPSELVGSNVARAIAVLPATGCTALWLEQVLRYEPNRLALEGVSHEVARKTLNLEDVRPFPVPVPPRAEEAVLVERVSNLLENSKNQGSTVSRQAAAAFTLRQSILAAAFRGELAT